MKGYDSEQVMSGTWGEIWIDDTYMAEVKKFRAEINASYEDVKRSRHLMIGKKLVSLSGEGEVTLNKTTSALMYKISDTEQDDIGAHVQDQRGFEKREKSVFQNHRKAG